MGGWRHAARGGNERVTVVTEVEVGDRETARKMGMWVCRGTHGSRENICSHGVKGRLRPEAPKDGGRGKWSGEMKKDRSEGGEGGRGKGKGKKRSGPSAKINATRSGQVQVCLFPILVVSFQATRNVISTNSAILHI